jgi:hypothetical protein
MTRFLRSLPTQFLPTLSLATLVVLAASGCAGGSGGGTSGPNGRGRDVAAERETAALEAEKRAAIKVASGADHRVDASAFTEEELAEFRRGWKYFLDHDPRWARARKDWLDKGGAAPYVLAENLFRYFWSASTLLKKDEVLRVAREAGHVGEPAVGYFADLLLLERWPLREAKTTPVFDPETGKSKTITVTHLEIDDVSRQNAALVLAGIGPPAVPTLASPAVLATGPSSSRTYAAYALGRIGDDAAVSALARMLREAPEWKDRGAAAKALGFALPTNPAARAPLEAALQDPDRFVRRKAQDALDGTSTLEF